jgi:hypothetical protein
MIVFYAEPVSALERIGNSLKVDLDARLKDKAKLGWLGRIPVTPAVLIMPIEPRLNVRNL